MFWSEPSVVGRHSKPSQPVCASAFSVSHNEASCADQTWHGTKASDSQVMNDNLLLHASQTVIVPARS